MRYWYAFVVTSADPRLASSYQRLIADSATPRCSTGTALCAINSPAGGPFPFSPLSTNLQSYIAAALANGTPQPEFPSGSRFFVYLKDL